MITLHIPTGKQAPDLSKEIMAARNIKDIKNKKNTISGLNKIQAYL